MTCCPSLVWNYARKDDLYVSALPDHGVQGNAALEGRGDEMVNDGNPKAGSTGAAAGGEEGFETSVQVAGRDASSKVLDAQLVFGRPSPGQGHLSRTPLPGGIGVAFHVGQQVEQYLREIAAIAHPGVRLGWQRVVEDHSDLAAVQAHLCQVEGIADGLRQIQRLFLIAELADRDFLEILHQLVRAL